MEVQKACIKKPQYTLKMLGKFSWVIVGWLRKLTILGNYYPIEPSNNLTNIGQLFLLNYWANIHQHF